MKQGARASPRKGESSSDLRGRQLSSQGKRLEDSRGGVAREIRGDDTRGPPRILRSQLYRLLFHGHLQRLHFGLHKQTDLAEL